MATIKEEIEKKTEKIIIITISEEGINLEKDKSISSLEVIGVLEMLKCEALKHMSSG